MASESAVRVRLVGANAQAKIEGLDPLPGHVNYLIGPDSKKWHRAVPLFGHVRSHEVYPGADIAYYGTLDALEYDISAGPGADVSKIKFAVEGPANTALSDAGDLIIAAGAGE